MKAKFYKGPWHGKSRDININAKRVEVVTPSDLNYWQNPAGLTDRAFNTVTYSVRMMSVTIDGHTYRAPAMHPDGSIFLVFDGAENV